MTVNGTWTTVTPTLGIASVTLAVSALPVGVRYAWHDFVECVLANNDSLPMGPFKESKLASTRTSTQTPAPVKGSPIQTPPMGFNSWNFYHCNIDENEIKHIADAM